MARASLDTLDIDVDGQHVLPEREAHDRCRRVAPHAWELGQIHRPAAGGDVPRRAVQVERAPVVAEPLPFADHVCDRGLRERIDGWPPLEPGEEVRDDAIDLRLLQHHLAHEDRVRIPSVPPRQIATGACKPLEQRLLHACDSTKSQGEPTRQGDAVTLTDFQKELCTTSRWDFTDLKALFVNCTLKPSPELSHTEGLMRISMAIMETNGVPVDYVRAVDRDLAPGVWPDMREHGAATDDWPALYEQVQAADILVLGSPIWLGEKSSICARVIERLYACSSLLNEGGQYAYYGKVGGCLITGNEDGIKHCSMSILYSLQHLGCTIPPQADAGWIGEAGPGPSYLDPGSGGLENDFTNRNTTFMTWNLLHLARLLKDAGGMPAHGNQRSLWDAGCRFDFANPDYR